MEKLARPRRNSQFWRDSDRTGWGEQVPLWALCLGVQAVDIGFMALVLANVESGAVDNLNVPHFTVVHGVWTHSLLMTVFYGSLCFAIGSIAKKPQLGVIAAIAVMSHWAGDLIVHVPDLPIGLTDTPSLGLGLWRWPLVATALELSLVVMTMGRYKLLGGLLIGVQIANDVVLPLDTNPSLLAVKALGLYAGVAALAWWSERRPS